MVAILIVLSTQALRLSRADLLKHSANWEDLNLAGRLEPLDASIARALYVRASGSAEHEAAGAAGLRRAISLNPRDAYNWIDLAFEFESRGEMKHAEESLQQAVRVNHMYAPAWAMANFYLRRGRTAECLAWVRKAAAFTDRDLTALFDVAWHADFDPDRILAAAIPPGAPSLTAYLSYLLAHDHLPAAGRVARELAAIAAADSSACLLEYCDRALGAHLSSWAPVLIVWNTMAQRKLILTPPLDPGREAVTNPAFAGRRIARGFDWIAAEIDGVSNSQSPDGWNMQFSGKQPEQCDLLEQAVPLEPTAAYTLRVSYSVAMPDAAPTGISWIVWDGGRVRILARGAELTSAQREESLIRLPPAGQDLVRVVLHYARPRGATRFEGALSLYSVHLAPERLSR